MTATKQPSGNVTSMSLRLFSRAPWTVSSRPGVGGRRIVGHRDRLAAGEVETGLGVAVLEQLLDRAGVDDLSAVLAGARTDVDDPVGRHDGLLVVLDDDQGVAEVLEPDEGLDQPLVVALVQPDARLVEHVEHADQPRADLGGQPDALCLAAGQRGGRPVEREVVETDVEEEAQPLLDLLEHALGDLPLAVGQLEVVEELGRLVDRERADLGDVAAARALVAQRDRDRDRLEPGALAGRARHLAHEALVALPAGVGLGLAVAPLDVGADALEVGVVGALAAVAVGVPDVHLGRVALEDALRPLAGRSSHGVSRSKPSSSPSAPSSRVK